MSPCEGCGGCSASGGCTSCSGCASLEMTQPEMDFLRLLGQVAFLPVARKAGDETPVCLELDSADREQTSLVLQCLEKKALVELDYSRPLKGASMEAYRGYPVWGSIALTARGQQVLELLEYQGFGEA